MTENTEIKTKKEWFPPDLKVLSIKNTLGGETFATGEDAYQDIDPTSGIG